MYYVAITLLLLRLRIIYNQFTKILNLLII